MNFKDLTAQAKALAPVIRDYVTKAADNLKAELFGALNERDAQNREAFQKLAESFTPDVDAIAAKAAELVPVPQDGKDADPEFVKQLVDEAVAKIPAPEHGKDGRDGENGQDGAQGEKGEPGQDGKDGASVTLDDVRPMVADMVAAAVLELPQAKDGRDGKDGESVPVEQVQKMIDEAVAKAVAAIELPKDGAPGRDAADIEILPAIDPEKSYPRGTYATADGGLWRSYQTTDGAKGWECIVDGIKSIEIRQKADRDFAVDIARSSGSLDRKMFTLPVVIDKGVYKHGDPYQQGDGVTWAGSFWIAQKDAPEDKPGMGDGWRLAVKKGRDGKDGDRGEKGEKGDKGRDGRDLTQMGHDGSKW